jgi:mannose-6-phosphate isomerase
LHDCSAARLFACQDDSVQRRALRAILAKSEAVEARIMTIGPCLVNPAFDEKPWGGRRLARYGFDLPGDAPIGEALITASEAHIVSGPLAGQTIGEAVARNPEQLLGADGLASTSGLPIFPLLVKIIDAERALSIQVHPSNETAPHGSLGKTEAWHVLEAAPGAVLYIGLKPDVTFVELAVAARTERPLAALLRAIPAEPGATVLMPAGTIHALGAGIVIYEIQQPSAITYRLDDWRRPNDPTPPREMHIEAGLAVLDAELRPEPRPLADPDEPLARLTECRFFALDRIALAAGGRLTLPASDGPRTITCLSGAARLSSSGGATTAAAGQTAVLFAGEGELRIEAGVNAVLLAGLVPPHSSDSGSSSR